MADVTTGQELNSYRGDAALGTGEASGYAKYDLSPLQTYALQRYNINLINYEQQQKDKKDLETKFNDPALYQDIDEGLATQIQPKLDRLKELAKENLQLKPNSEKWYEFHNLWNDIKKDNARAKVVQTEKDKFKDAAGRSKDEHEREKMNAYVKQLEGYKMGDDVPSYTSYIPFNEKHLPETQTATGVTERVVGNKLQTVKYSVNNALDLDQKAKLQRLANPQSFATGEDLGHTLMQHGGVPELNKAAKDAYDKSLTYNIGVLQDKYKTDFGNYKKSNPAGTFQDFMTFEGKADELQKIYDGHAFLRPKPGVPAVEYIPVKPGEEQLANFTYSPDGKSRLSVDNDTLRAIYKATEKPAGYKEEIIKEELSTKPAEIELRRQQALAAAKNAETNRMKANQSGQLTKAKITKLQRQTAAINPLPPSEVPLIARESVLKTVTGTGNSKEDQFLINTNKIPEALRKKAGFLEPPVKPKITGDKTKDDAALKAYNNQKAKADNSVHQMRFFDTNGNDVTQKIANKLKSQGGNLTDGINKAINAAMTNGYVLKFVDNTGKVVGTTESIDRQTLIENNKVNTKGDEALGTDLPEDDNEE